MIESAWRLYKWLIVPFLSIRRVRITFATHHNNHYRYTSGKNDRATHYDVN